MALPVGDIETRSDCERLVRAFYGRALEDEVIGWLFTDIARLDLEAHVPRITAFWETVLLGAGTYSGGAFRPHVALHARARLRGGHFERWLHLWNETVDGMFSGPRAQLAKGHAARVARAFASRLGAYEPPPTAAVSSTGGPLAITLHGPGGDGARAVTGSAHA